jgi:hypothetical protein
MVISFVEKDKDFDKTKHNRRNRERYILTTSFSHFSDKSYIDSAFINEEDRKESTESFNNLYNEKFKHKYFYGLDRGTNELITL